MYNEHENKDIVADIIRLSDALCQPTHDLIVALFRRIGDQFELKDEWKKLPNAERSDMAGDFYNIIAAHTNIPNDGDVVLNLIKDFIIKNKICSAETVYQSDRVIENAYDFIESLCEIVGYYDDD